MKNKFLAVLLLLFPLPVLAQVGNPSITVVQSAPSGACTNNLPDQQVATTGLLYSCQNGTWTQVGSGAGGPPSGAAGGALGGTYPNPTVVGAISPSSVTNSSWTQGEPLYPSSAGLLGSSAAYLDCSSFPGSDVSLKIQSCIVAGATLNANAVIIDARGITANLTGTVDPFDASSISRSGAILMPCGVVITPVPWVHQDNWSEVGCSSNSNNGVNYSIGGVGVTGSTLQASSDFPPTYSTGTVSVAGAGYKEVITGSGTTWSTNVVKGCAFVAPAAGYQGTSSWGIVYAVISNTSITLGYGHNNGTDVSAGSTYDIFCPVDVLGDASTSTANANASFQYGMADINMSYDANNIAGAVPLMNWFGGQHSFAKNVNLFDYCGMGFDDEGEYTQNSGPWEDMVIAPGTCGVAGSKAAMIAPNGGHQEFRNITTNQGTSSTSPTVGIDIEGTGVSLEGADVEKQGTGIAINAKAACIPACQQAGPNILGSPGAINVQNVYAGSLTTNAVQIYNSNGNPRGVTLENIQGFNTHAVVDSYNGCTSSSEHLAYYTLDENGRIASSASTTAGCNPPVKGSTNTQVLTSDSSGITATTPGTSEWTWSNLGFSKSYAFHCSILYSQATAAGGVGFAVQSATTAATRWDAWAKIYTTNPASTTVTGTLGSALDVTTTTATSVASATPGATGTVYQGEIDGTIQTGTTAGTLHVLAYTGNASDAVTIKAGSYCALQP